MTRYALPAPEPRAYHQAERDYHAAVEHWMANPYTAGGDPGPLTRMLEAQRVLEAETARWYLYATCEDCGEACTGRPGGLPDLCPRCIAGRDSDFVMKTEGEHVHD